MAEMMKAAVVHEFGKPLMIDEIAIPDVPDDKILVKVMASGVCHTDLHAASGDWPVKPSLPFVPGHEGVGYVAKVGKRVASLKEGDRVGVPWLHTTCGHCEFCITGWETLCDEQQMTGYTVNGGYADYVLADPNYVGHLPSNLSFESAAPILCAGVTVYKGLKVLDCKPGDWVVISGIGGLGHMAVQYAKAMGLNVIGVDVSNSKLELAKSLGADETINVTEIDPVKEVQSRIKGAHGVLVTAVSNHAFSQGLGMLHKRGTMSLVGLPPGDFAMPIFDMVLNAKTVRGSIVGTRKDLQESLAFAGQGKVKAHYSIDRLDNINNIFKSMKDGLIDGRIVLTM